MNTIEQYRQFLKDAVRKSIDFHSTDQSRGIAPPPVEKPFDPGLPRIQLPSCQQWSREIKSIDLVTAMAGRKSRRNFTSSGLSLAELTFLLWATQGVRMPGEKSPAYRTVPSAGARHSFETYLFIFRVDGIAKGLYRYLPIENELLFLREIGAIEPELSTACLGQTFAARGAVTFVWTTLPYRMEWRYSLAAHRVILIDAGHVCQNLYLACEAIAAGTCAIGAYDQDRLDRLLDVDGKDEFAIYLAAVGKINASAPAS